MVVRRLPTPASASEPSVNLVVEFLEKVGHGGSSTANTYVSIRTIRQPRFWKRSEKLSPINSDSKDRGNIIVEHMFLRPSIIVHHTQSSSR